MRTAASIVSAVAMIGLVATTARAQSCVGDCRNTGMVGIADLILGVNISLGTAQLSACPSFDCEHNGTVPVACLIQGVNHSLNSDCQAGGETERIFTIDPGSGQADPPSCTPEPCPSTRTGLFTSALGNVNATLDTSPGPFKLELGTPNAMGVASLRLKEDVPISVVVVNSTCLCLKFLAAGSSGSIDCDGGTAYDTTITQPAGPDPGWTQEEGLGSPAGPGNGNLLVMTMFQYVDTDPALPCGDHTCCEGICNNVTYANPPNLFPFTTTTATAVKNVTQGNPVTLSDPGEAFSCANFATPSSGGMLASGAAITILGLDTANVFRFSEAVTPK